MKELIIKLIVFIIISFAGGFLDVFLKDHGINWGFAIHFTIGYVNCLIWNWEAIVCQEKRKKKLAK